MIGIFQAHASELILSIFTLLTAFAGVFIGNYLSIDREALKERYFKFYTKFLSITRFYNDTSALWIMYSEEQKKIINDFLGQNYHFASANAQQMINEWVYKCPDAEFVAATETDKSHRDEILADLDDEWASLCTEIRKEYTDIAKRLHYKYLGY